MNNFKLANTTLGEISLYRPSIWGWKSLCTGLGKRTVRNGDLDTEVTIKQILDINGVGEAFWALRTQDIRLQRLIAADVAESVLHIFEEEYPEDKRPREYIEVIRKWCRGDATDEELEAVHQAVSWSVSAGDHIVGVVTAIYWATAPDWAVSASASAYHATRAAGREDDQRKKYEEILRKYMD